MLMKQETISKEQLIIKVSLVVYLLIWEKGKVQQNQILHGESSCLGFIESVHQC